LNVLKPIGFTGYRAWQSFHILMLGLKMLPMYLNEAYEDFYNRFDSLPEDEQEIMIRQAACFVPLTKEELEALVCLSTDSNGIPYEASNIKNLTPHEFHEAIVAVCMEIGKIKIDLLSNAEKKNLRTLPSMSVNN
jgi:hypothetical protein